MIIFLLSKLPIVGEAQLSAAVKDAGARQVPLSLSAMSEPRELRSKSHAKFSDFYARRSLTEFAGDIVALWHFSKIYTFCFFFLRSHLFSRLMRLC